MARQFGATHFINAAEVDTVEAVKEICPNGVDVSFECVGHPALIRNAVDALDWGGTAVILGVPKFGTEASFLVSAMYNDKTIMGCRYGAGRPHKDIPLFVDLYLAGRLKLDELVTKTYDLGDIRPDHRRHAQRRPGAWRAADRLRWRCPRRRPSWPRRCRNWGRWGDDDERGTANLIDDAALRRGLDAVGAGRHLSLAIPLDQRSPQHGGAPGRIAPLRTMLSINQTYTGQDGDAAFNDDTVVMAMAAGTHIDALGHCSYGGFLYNGFPADDVPPRPMASRDAVPTRSGRIMSRGVLLDLPAAIGVDRLDAGYAVTADDLDAAVALAGVEPVPGDVLCVRTGHMQWFHEGETSKYNHDSPGLSTHTIPWIREHDCGAVFTDTYIYEVWPPQDWAAMMVVHMIHLRDMGQVQGQNFDFEALAAACAGGRVLRVPVQRPSGTVHRWLQRPGASGRHPVTVG